MGESARRLLIATKKYGELGRDDTLQGLQYTYSFSKSTNEVFSVECGTLALYNQVTYYGSKSDFRYYNLTSNPPVYPYIEEEQTTQWPKDTKRVIRIRISKKDRQHNGQKIPKG